VGVVPALESGTPTETAFACRVGHEMGPTKSGAREAASKPATESIWRVSKVPSIKVSGLNDRLRRFMGVSQPQELDVDEPSTDSAIRCRIELESDSLIVL